MNSNRRQLTAAIVAATVVLGVGLTAAARTTERRESARPQWQRDWAQHLQAATAAQHRGDLATAARAWRTAYGAARKGHGWAAPIAVADAHLALAAAVRAELRPQARELYMEALLRAHDAGSLDGVLRAAEGFEILGDRHMVARSVRIAREVAGGNATGETLARLRALDPS